MRHFSFQKRQNNIIISIYRVLNEIFQHTVFSCTVRLNLSLYSGPLTRRFFLCLLYVNIYIIKEKTSQRTYTQWLI